MSSKLEAFLAHCLTGLHLLGDTVAGESNETPAPAAKPGKKAAPKIDVEKDIKPLVDTLVKTYKAGAKIKEMMKGFGGVLISQSDVKDHPAIKAALEAIIQEEEDANV